MMPIMQSSKMIGDSIAKHTIEAKRSKILLKNFEYICNLASLFETASYDFDDRILLILCHFDIAGQAKTSIENVGADILVTERNKLAVRKNRLHMHRFPYWPSLCIMSSKRLQNLSRATFSSFFYVISYVIATDLIAHSLSIDK
jgi:hypothetical protein